MNHDYDSSGRIVGLSVRTSPTGWANKSSAAWHRSPPRPARPALRVCRSQPWSLEVEGVQHPGRPDRRDVIGNRAMGLVRSFWPPMPERHGPTGPSVMDRAVRRKPLRQSHPPKLPIFWDSHWDWPQARQNCRACHGDRGPGGRARVLDRPEGRAATRRLAAAREATSGLVDARAAAGDCLPG